VGGSPQGENFRVGGGVTAHLGFITGAGQNRAIGSKDHGADRDLATSGSSTGFGKGDVHGSVGASRHDRREIRLNNRIPQIPGRIVSTQGKNEGAGTTMQRSNIGISYGDGGRLSIQSLPPHHCYSGMLRDKVGTS
jgi:hypothetical protein